MAVSVQDLDLEQIPSPNQSRVDRSSRFRRDILWSPGERGANGELNWIAKDPISLKYFKLRDDERFILLKLDGLKSINTIRDLYNESFAPRRVSSAQVQQLVSHFFKEGLVQSPGSNQANALTSKRTQLLRDRLRQRTMAWLFLRLPGIHADRIAESLESIFRPVLNQLCLILLAIFVAVSGFWLSMHLDTFTRDVREFGRWASVHGLVTLACVIGVCKSLHELGHAIACKRFGGECHEIGLMFMFGIPCLYCDTTDAWRIPNRWHRITISAGGIIVEMLLGGIAIWIWETTSPGILHWASVDVILVCLVGSVLFNANPLLRYDGYYILSDYLGIANLQSEAKKHWERIKKRLLIGPQPRLAPERTTATQIGLILYHWMASVYRWLLLLGLGWMVLYTTRVGGYQQLGWQIIALGLAVLLLVNYIPRLHQSIKTNLAQQFRSHWFNELFRAWGLRIGLLSFFVLLITYPIPRQVLCVGELRPTLMTPILSSVAGSLEKWTPYASAVSSGEVLVELTSSRTRIDALVADGKWERQKLVVDGLSKLQIDAPDLAARIPSAETLLNTLAIQRREANQLVNQLIVRTVTPGIWIEPTKTPRHRMNSKSLGNWDEFPLKDSNSGCWIEPGTLLGWIASPDSWSIEVLVSQDEIEWIRAGQKAELRLAAYSERSLAAEVVEISTQPATSLSPRQSSWPGVINDGKSVATGSGEQPAEAPPGTPPGINPLNVSYWVTLRISNFHPSGHPIDDTDSLKALRHFIGTEGIASIEVGKESLFDKTRRWIASQFKL